MTMNDILARAASFRPDAIELTAMVCAAAVFLVVLILRLTGKRRRTTPTMEYYAPDGLNPAEVGYIIDGHASPNDMATLIYYWASHGHLSISMEEDGGIRLDRLSDPDDAHSDYERRMYSDLWRIGDPDYYYNVLPYAHALGVSDIWAEKFHAVDTPRPRWFTEDHGGSNEITSAMMAGLDALIGLVKRREKR